MTQKLVNSCQRIIKGTNGKKTIYHYDQVGNIISEETIGSQIVRDYIYIGHSRIAMVLSKRCLPDLDKDNDVDGNELAILASDFNRNDCSSASPCPGDVNGDRAVNSDDLSILASELGKTYCPHDEYYYFHNDHLGTPQKITDQSGAVVWSANYKPFGQADITIDTITNPFRFPGQYFDPETGLHYNYFRYYDPGTGRYLTSDPIGIVPYGSQGDLTHIFNYARGNPIRYLDPDGLKEAGYSGWEIQFVVGYGQAYVTCCDGTTLRKHKYRKVCFGAGFIVGVSSGAAFGGQNHSCTSPPQYLVSPELGFGIYGPLGIEGGAGFSSSGMTPFLGASTGTGFKATVCFYWLSGSEEIGCCLH